MSHYTQTNGAVIHTRLHMLATAGLMCLALGLSAGGCGLGDLASPLNNAVTAIDSAINSLNVNSAHWEQIMRDLKDSFPAAENDIKNDVDEVLQRAEGGATTDLIATADFFARRMTEGLERIRAQILHEPYTPPPPAFITFAPDKIEMTRVASNDLNSVSVFGYDFDRIAPDGKPLQLMLFDNNQLVNVTHALALPTHYRAVFNLGSNGVALTHNSDQLQLMWNGLVISTLSIIQPPVPQPRDITVQLRNLAYTPPHTRGDEDFAGAGPAVHLRTYLAAGGANTLIAKVYMKAEETEDDWTTAEGSSDWETVYQTPPGVQLLAILSPVYSEASYVDTNHDQDIIQMGAYDLVTQYVCVGDTTSDHDAGHATSVNVLFNEIKIRVLGP